jgi:metallo-beta-lactamase class B
MRNRVSSVLAASVAVIFACGANAFAQEDPKLTQPKEPDAIQQHVEKAYAIAGDDPNLSEILHLQCSPKQLSPAVTPQYTQDRNPLGPAKVFDQLYFLGMPWVSSWAIDTSDGIVLIDTLDNSEEAQRVIEGGMKKVGLDPARIKYIILSHGHADHFGGANYFVQKYHPKVLLSAGDWEFMHRPPQGNQQPPNPDLRPAHDTDVTDGQKLTVGKTTFTFYIAPGHTPATLAIIFPVTDHGKPHMAGFMGGVGIPTNLDPSPVNGGILNFAKSVERFMKIAEDQKVDVVLSSHPFGDGTIEKLPRFEHFTGKGDPNPFVVGIKGAQAYYGVYDECALAWAERIKAKNAAGGQGN